MRALLLALVAAVVSLTTRAQTTKTMELENYNSWNLPFAKTFSISAIDKTDQTFPTTKYTLEVDPASFITVIYVDTSLSIPDTPITMNYTWYG